MANSADPDQLASSEANWSGFTLFERQGISGFSMTRVKCVLSGIRKVELIFLMVSCCYLSFLVLFCNLLWIWLYPFLSSLIYFATLWANSADDKLTVFFLFFEKIGFGTSCKLSPHLRDNLQICQSLFYKKIQNDVYWILYPTWRALNFATKWINDCNFKLEQVLTEFQILPYSC